MDPYVWLSHDNFDYKHILFNLTILSLTQEIITHLNIKHITRVHVQDVVLVKIMNVFTS